jgi:hypothetical protein
LRSYAGILPAQLDKRFCGKNTARDGDGMKLIKTKRLQLGGLDRKIENDRDDGALIYITHVSEDREPMNFKVQGSSATSGYWSKGLRSRPFTWMLIYQRIGNNLGDVWIGEHESTSETSAGQYVFHLSNVAGPLRIQKSVHELVGKRAPQNPIYLSGTSPGRKVETQVAKGRISAGSSRGRQIETQLAGKRSTNPRLARRI